VGNKEVTILTTAIFAENENERKSCEPRKFVQNLQTPKLSGDFKRQAIQAIALDLINLIAIGTIHLTKTSVRDLRS
jgi:hypothetical protein